MIFQRNVSQNSTEKSLSPKLQDLHFKRIIVLVFSFCCYRKIGQMATLKMIHQSVVVNLRRFKEMCFTLITCPCTSTNPVHSDLCQMRLVVAAFFLDMYATVTVELFLCSVCVLVFCHMALSSSALIQPLSFFSTPQGYFGNRCAT